MPVDQGGIGGGGGTNICNVSPSDQIGTLDNILNRLQALESVMATLLGTNVEAAQLSDISNSLGWVYNVSFLGTEGWTQTPAGTLIPPSGWTGLSDLITPGQTTLYSGGGSVGGFNAFTVNATPGNTINSGVSYTCHPNGTVGLYNELIDTGETGLYESTVGSITSWRSDSTASFAVFVWCYITKGSSAPTSGFPVLLIDLVEMDGSSSNFQIGYGSGPFPTTHSSFINASAFAIMSRTVSEGFRFRIFNRTDGQIVLTELRATFLKLA